MCLGGGTCLTYIRYWITIAEGCKVPVLSVGGGGGRGGTGITSNG